MELVKQIQINIPYILQLVKQYHDENCKDKTVIAKIQKAIGSSPDLRDKKDLIMEFIERMTPSKDTRQQNDKINDKWNEYVNAQREKELQQIIKDEKLREEETRKFIEQFFADGYITTTGLAITKVLSSMPLFGGGVANCEKKNRLYSTNSPHSLISTSIYDFSVINVSIQTVDIVNALPKRIFK